MLLPCVSLIILPYPTAHRIRWRLSNDIHRDIDRKLRFESPSSILSEILRGSNPFLLYRASQFLTRKTKDRRRRREFGDPSYFVLASRFLVSSTSYITPSVIEKQPTLSAVRETGYKLRGKTRYGRSTFGVIHSRDG